MSLSVFLENMRDRCSNFFQIDDAHHGAPDALILLLSDH